MNEIQIREERTETPENANADLEKWADAINNLLRIIERSERKLGYFQNRGETGELHGSSESP